MIDAASRDPRALPDLLVADDAFLLPFETHVPALFLDFDGVLAPLVDRPELAAPSPPMRAVVERLGAWVRVAIVSGRDRRDIEQRLGLAGITYAGSHGFDIAGPDGLRHLVGEDWLPVLDQAEAALSDAVGGIGGVLIDRKRFAIAIHFRAVAAELHAEIAARVDVVAAAHPELRRKSGKMIWELQPDFDWHKGRAVGWLLDHWPRPARPWFPIYLGDDVTDEDGFAAVAEEGLGILVEPGERPTLARASLPDVEGVRLFLERLERAMGVEPTTSSLGS